MSPIVLAILDGFGVAPDAEGNAITRAQMPHYQKFVRTYPAMTLIASGAEVGLQWGEMGNSEVGHLNIGAGRVYYQMYPRINREINNGAFFQNPAFLKTAAHIKKYKSALHLVGILSPGNIHGSQEHIFALLQFAKQQKIKKVFIHAILDGRDTAKNSGAAFVAQLQKKIDEIGAGKIATLTGRHFAMDRDNRWERTETAYRAIAQGLGAQEGEDAVAIIQNTYATGVFDEEFPATVLKEKTVPLGMLKNGDAVIFTNWRADRMRQLAAAFALPSFPKFKRPAFKDLFITAMAEYGKNLPVLVAYSPLIVKKCLAETVSNANLSQFHIAETEKYAHITYFLNGMVEEPFPKEIRAIIPSPKVASYDATPEMAAPQIGKAALEALKKDAYDFIALNFANADMVGHTGNFTATKKAVEAIDKQLGKIADYVLAKNGVLIITADHGNAENKINLRTGAPDKEHTTNPVPFIVVGSKYEGKAGMGGDAPQGDLSLLQPVGILADVAPTVLKIMELDQPEEMTGRVLV